jgi:hypothetical protein
MMNIREQQEQARLTLINARADAHEKRIAFEEQAFEADLNAINQMFGYEEPHPESKILSKNKSQSKSP